MIGDDMNPAHIIRESLTQSFAMGYPDSLVDDTLFTAAADTLYDEGFGLSMQWVRSEPIDDFINRVLEIIAGVRTENKATGQIGIKLIRDDYTPANLVHFDESNVRTLDRFERRAWGDTINKMQVSFYDPTIRNESVVTLHDIGNYNRQNRVVGQKREYKGISSYTLASQVCARELKTAAAPLSKLSLTVDRTGVKLSRGELFRFSWASLNIVDTVYRVLEIDHGELTDGTVTIEAIEDIFAMPNNVYIQSQASEWTNPVSDPVAVTTQLAIEASYWDVIRDYEAGIISGFAADFGIAHLLAAAPLNSAYGYDLWATDTNPAVSDYLYIEESSFTPTATLAADINRTVTANIPIANGQSIEGVQVGTIAYIGDEAVKITAINLTSDSEGTIDVGRSVVDTVPQTHTLGDRIWFPNDTYYGESSVESDGETIYMKALTKTGAGTLAEAAALEASVLLDQRYQRPYPPGLVELNGTAFPATTDGDIVITWAHRDRLTQGATLVDHTQASIGPEAGTTYTIRIIDPAGPTTLHTESGLTGTTWTYTQVARQADFGGVGPHSVRIEIEALRDGLTSRQMHSMDVTANDL
jgi:hypothetical protein